MLVKSTSSHRVKKKVLNQVITTSSKADNGDVSLVIICKPIRIDFFTSSASQFSGSRCSTYLSSLKLEQVQFGD